jgi:hypothetical protein
MTSSTSAPADIRTRARRVRALARTRPAVAAFCGVAATAAVVAVALTPASAAGRPAHRPSATAVVSSAVPVVINCAGHAQTRPRSYILACADAGAYVSKMSWASWGSSAAFGSGTYDFQVCIPTCVAGHLATFPALAALWRAEPLPGHPAERYFTRLTLIFTGSRTYKGGGKTYSLPPTKTFPLAASGGA